MLKVNIYIYTYIFNVFSCFVKWYTKGILTAKLINWYIKGICIEGIVKAY